MNLLSKKEESHLFGGIFIGIFTTGIILWGIVQNNYYVSGIINTIPKFPLYVQPQLINVGNYAGILILIGIIGVSMYIYSKLHSDTNCNPEVDNDEEQITHGDDL